MHQLAVLLFALAAVCSHCEAKVFTKCELVRELRRQGFPAGDLRDWVCLIEKESSFNTAALTQPDNKGHQYWGLFQISDGYWCSTGTSPGKDCNVRCHDLITDDITKASNCAKLIYKRHKFNLWNAWKNKCRGQKLPDISDCR